MEERVREHVGSGIQWTYQVLGRGWRLWGYLTAHTGSCKREVR